MSIHSGATHVLNILPHFTEDTERCLEGFVHQTISRSKRLSLIEDLKCTKLICSGISSLVWYNCVLSC